MIGEAGEVKRAHRPLGAAVFLAVLVSALGLVAPARAFDRPPKLEQVASYFAQRPVEVRCPSIEEWRADKNVIAGWAYTHLTQDWIVLHPALCEGALRVADERVPAFQRAMGVETLVHESFHVRRWRYRRNEGRVQCQAITHFKTSAEMLGASPEQANDLLGYALAFHLQTVTLFSAYAHAGCKLPVWKPPLEPIP
jgi:hypothetical protein